MNLPRASAGPTSTQGAQRTLGGLPRGSLVIQTKNSEANLSFRTPCEHFQRAAEKLLKPSAAVLPALLCQPARNPLSAPCSAAPAGHRDRLRSFMVLNPDKNSPRANGNRREHCLYHADSNTTTRKPKNLGNESKSELPVRAGLPGLLEGDTSGAFCFCTGFPAQHIHIL